MCIYIYIYFLFVYIYIYIDIMPLPSFLASLAKSRHAFLMVSNTVYRIYIQYRYGSNKTHSKFQSGDLCNLYSATVGYCRLGSYCRRGEVYGRGCVKWGIGLKTNHLSSLQSEILIWFQSPFFLLQLYTYIYIYVLNIECSYDIILYIFMCYDNQFDLNMYHLS